MIVFSTLWRTEESEKLSYYLPFWENSVYGFEALEGERIDEKWMVETPLEISNVCMKIPGKNETFPSLLSEKQEEKEKAFAALARVCQHAIRLKAPYVVVWPGKIPIAISTSTNEGSHSLTQENIQNRKQRGPSIVDRLCRLIFDMSRKFPDLSFCLSPGRALNEAPLIHEMEWILGDLKKENLRYWHNTAHAHLQQKIGLSSSEAWLEKFCDRMVGVHLEDVMEGDTALPGIGEVDFSILKNYLRPKTIRVVRAASRFELHEIWFSFQHLKEKNVL